MKISAVEALPVRLPRNLTSAQGLAGSPTALAGPGEYRWSQAYPALYSVNIETALVKVTLENGLVGWGESQAPLAPEVAATIIDKLLAPVLCGEELDGIDRLWWRMYSTMRVRGQTGGFMLDAISGVDLALWDLRGKLAGKPVAALLAGDSARSRVPAYLSGLAGANNTARRDFAHRYQDQGFQHCKIYYDTDWNELLTLADAVRPDMEVAIDSLWHLDPALAPQTDEHDLLWLECPLPPEDPLAHAGLARSLRTPIALGESYRTCFELAPFFRERAMRIVQPDLGRSGITESRRIAHMAAEHGMSIIPHVSIAFGPQIAAAIHFAAATPNCSLCEYNPAVLETANRFLREPLRLDEAKYVVPTSPGLGVEIQENLLR